MPYLDPNPLLGLKVGDQVRLVAHASRDKRLDHQPNVDRIVTVTHINLDGSFLVGGRPKGRNHYQRDGLPLGKTKGVIVAVHARNA